MPVICAFGTTGGFSGHTKQYKLLGVNQKHRSVTISLSIGTSLGGSARRLQLFHDQQSGYQLEPTAFEVCFGRPLTTKSL